MKTTSGIPAPSSLRTRRACGHHRVGAAGQQLALLDPLRHRAALRPDASALPDRVAPVVPGTGDGVIQAPLARAALRAWPAWVNSPAPPTVVCDTAVR